MITRTRSSNLSPKGSRVLRSRFRRLNRRGVNVTITHLLLSRWQFVYLVARKGNVVARVPHLLYAKQIRHATGWVCATMKRHTAANIGATTSHFGLVFGADNVRKRNLDRFLVDVFGILSNFCFFGECEATAFYSNFNVSTDKVAQYDKAIYEWEERRNARTCEPQTRMDLLIKHNKYKNYSNAISLNYRRKKIGSTNLIRKWFRPKRKMCAGTSIQVRVTTVRVEFVSASSRLYCNPSPNATNSCCG